MTYLDWVMIIMTILSCGSMMMETPKYRIMDNKELQVCWWHCNVCSDANNISSYLCHHDLHIVHSLAFTLKYAKGKLTIISRRVLEYLELEGCSASWNLTEDKNQTNHPWQVIIIHIWDANCHNSIDTCIFIYNRLESVAYIK